MPRWINLTLPIATLVAFAVLALWFGGQVQTAAGGLAPFDMRLTGYGLAEARAYLTALSPEGRALYLGPIRITDTIFPVLLTLTLCLPLRGWSWPWFLPALVYGLLDLSENVAVAGLLQIGPEVRASQVLMASMLTMAKFVVVVLAVGLALWGIWRHWRQR